MDPLSVASGVAGLLSLTIQVGMAIGKYTSSVKGASKAAQKLEREITAFSSVLKQLCTFLLSKDADHLIFEATSVLLVATDSCKTEFGDLEKKVAKFSKGDKASQMLQKLSWPFTEKEEKETINTIHRWTALYNLSLQTAGCRLLSKVKEDVVESLNLQLEQMQQMQHLYSEAQALTDSMSNVRELVVRLPDISKTVEKTYSIVQNLDRTRLDEDRMKILGWLSRIAHYEKQTDTLRRRHGTTGMWFLELDEFQDWLHNEDKNILWCKGDPGVGKTILASVAIDHITKSKKDSGLAFFYFDFGSEHEHTPVQILSSLLKQLLLQLDELPLPVWQKFNRSVMQGHTPQVNELQELLLSIPNSFKSVYVVVDALDECKVGDCRDEILRAFETLQASMKLMVTSRPHIEDLGDSLAQATHVKLKAVESDISDYVYTMLETRKIKKILGKDEALKQEIVDSIVSDAHGMFLLPSLQIQAILDQTTKGEIKKCLKNMPSKLDDNYRDILKRIEEQPPSERHQALRILMWIAHAKRPLRQKELLHGLAIRPGEFTFDEDDLPCEDLLVEYCMGLVQIDPESTVIRLVHPTLREYFKKRARFLFPEGHSDIAQACLTYLCLDAISSGPCLSDEEYESRVESWPLLHYAAQYWGDHAREDPEETYKSLAVEFCSNNQHVGCAAQAMGVGNHLYQGYSQRFRKSFTGLHVASSFGLKNIVEALLDQGADIEAKYEKGETALCMASVKGDVEVVRVLLDRGAKVEVEGNGGKRALHQAAWHGHSEVVKLLVEKKADIEATDDAKFTPLQMAASYGQSEVLTLLLKDGAEKETRNLWAQTALHRAAVCNHKKAVEILLDNGADAEASDNDSSTTLHMVASIGLSTVVEVLLAKKAKSEARDKWGQTPLYKAASAGHAVTVRTLLDGGADIKARSEDGETALHGAALEGHSAMVKLLLERGAEIDALDKNGRTPSLMAASNGHSELVKLLSSKGAKQDEKGMALLTAASADQLSLVQQLLDTRTAGIPDEYGRMTLLIAAAKNELDVVKQLLDMGTDIEAEDVTEKTALFKAAAGGHLATTKLLLDRGANIEAKEKYYAHTALYDAARGGHFKVVKLLLDRGANSEAKETVAGWTVLHWATASGDFDLVKLLLENGASVQAKNSNGGTALDMAEWVDHSKIAELIKLKMESAVYVGKDGKEGELEAAKDFNDRVMVYVSTHPKEDATPKEDTTRIAIENAG